MSEAKGERKARGIVAGALFGGLSVGALGLVAAAAAFLDGQFNGGGICLLAAALAFGLVANACLRS